MLDTDKNICSILIDVLAGQGVKEIVCSPGSRNAPLIIAAQAREELRKHVVVDERSAGYFALGISIVSKSPVALICTSGTALLNYAPAVAEAFYQGIPLIVISADRPEQWIDQDDSQTIKQFKALQNIVKASYDLSEKTYPESDLDWYANRIANEAMLTALSGKKGPVHINVRLSEPLGCKTEREENKENRIISLLQADTFINKEIINNLASELASHRVMLVGGYMQPDAAMQKAFAEFSHLSNVVVMTETLSNVHIDGDNYSIDSILTYLTEEEKEKLRPDIIISVGGSLVSRKLKEYLRTTGRNCRHWNVGLTGYTADCFKSMTLKIEVEPSRFLRNIAKRLSRISIDDEVSSFKSQWQEKRKEAKIVKTNYIKEAPWSELKIFDTVLKSIPASFNLFLSNGTAVRYAQIIPYKLPHASYCNRGVSGIDGSVSSAVGGAVSYGGKTLLITGDLSLSYDMTALTLCQVPNSMKIIVIDNAGGGIFRFIPSTCRLEEREKYFCADPSLKPDKIAEAYGWEFYDVVNEDKLKKCLPKFFNSDRKSLMRIKCDGITSAEVLKGYMNEKRN